MAKNSLRKLSDNELSYLKFGNLASPFFAVFLELKPKGNQKLSSSVINNAFRRTIDLYDELNTRASKNRFINQKNTAQLKTIVHDFDGYNFEDVLKELPGTEPVQLYFLNQQFLIFRFNHAHIDGGGSFLFIDSFLEYLAGKLPSNNTNSYISDIDFVKDLTKVDQKRGLSFKNKLMTKPAALEGRIYYKRLTIEQRTSFLLSKIITVTNNYFSNEKTTYLLPTNIRRLRPAISSVSNLTEILYLECNKDDSWLDISKKIHKKISQNDNLNIKNIDYGIIMDLPSTFYQQLVKISSFISRTTGRFLTAGSITTITHHFDAQLSPKFSISTAFMLPFYQPLLPYVINIIETKHKTEIIFCSNDNYIDPQTANDILNRIKEVASQ